ncbi:hypothetical protein DXG01_003202 [Tephrocybe rancida]|nr:hypothetical protein DXG01_003202 [Tephrocybe rancida]
MRVHPIINIAHLEHYHQSPPEFGRRPTKDLDRADFEELPEDVEKIIAERSRKAGNRRRVMEYRTRYTKYGPQSDEWLTAKELKNAPLVLKAWEERKWQLGKKAAGT